MMKLDCPSIQFHGIREITQADNMLECENLENFRRNSRVKLTPKFFYENSTAKMMLDIQIHGIGVFIYTKV